MQNPMKPFAVIVVVLVATTSLITMTTGSAAACSCASPNPLAMIPESDVVFTGTVLPDDQVRFGTRWDFAVEGVIKGEVGSNETVTGDDSIGQCGPELGRFSYPIVVFADELDGKLVIGGCTPVPSVDDFAAMIDQQAAEPTDTGTGPPAAIARGSDQQSNLLVLNGQGRTIARAWLDAARAGGVAHCPGSTAAVIVSGYPDATLTTLDLESLTVTAQRSIDSGFWGFNGDQVACLGDAKTIVTSSGFGPESERVEVASISLTSDDVEIARQSFDDVSRGVIGPTGIIYLLPSLAASPLRALDPEHLGDIPLGADILPTGATAIAGAVAPDGSELAVLARLDGVDLGWDSGATHILVIPLDNGVPSAPPVVSIELNNAGDTIFAPQAGAADAIAWLDESTWIVQATTGTNNRMRVVDRNGTHVVDNVFSSWGSDPVAISSGALRSTKGGIEFIRATGEVSDGDPAPTFRQFGWFAIAPLIDPPAFTPIATQPERVIEIQPVAAGTASPRPTVIDTPVGRFRQRTVALGAVAAVALACAGALIYRRQRGEPAR